MYSTFELFLIISIIGVTTLFFRSIFLFKLPSWVKHPIVKRGMDAVPSAMLVALVIPFTFFVDKKFLFLRLEVGAILGTIPIVYFTKKYSYGLIFAIILYIFLLIVIP